jgi:hypothetical protein
MTGSNLWHPMGNTFVAHNRATDTLTKSYCRCAMCKEVLQYYSAFDRAISTAPRARQYGLVLNHLMNIKGPAYAMQAPNPDNYNRPNDIRKRRVSMSAVNICDRCGAMVKGNALGALSLATSNDPHNVKRFDKELCPDCIALFYGLLVAEDVEPKQRAYQKPFSVPREAPKSVAEALENTSLADFVRTVVKEVHEGQTAIEAPRDSE